MKCKSKTIKGKSCKLEGKYTGYCHIHFPKHQNTSINNDVCCCSICLDNINSFKEFFSLNCGHYFHIQCIQSWIKRKYNCPLCRSKVDKRICDKLGIHIYDDNSHIMYMNSGNDEPLENVFTNWFIMFSVQEIIHIVSCFDDNFRPILIENILQVAYQQEETEYMRELMIELIQM